VNKSASLKEMASLISQRTDIAAENIMVTKISSPWNFHRVELPFTDWMHIGKDNEFSTNVLQSAPFYISTDGILFVIKDSSIDGRDMTREEKDLYHCEEI
jgi:hypothetical protein